MELNIDKASLRNYAYYLLIVFYLIMSYFPTEEVTQYSFRYFLFVLPVLGFIGFFATNLITRRYNLKSLVCQVLLLSVAVVSIVRYDVSTILSIFLFTATLVVIFNSKITPSIKFINFLFLLSIIGSIISYHVGLSEFPYIPEFDGIQNLVSGEIGWRISLFPLITESGFFALLVIISNYFLNKNWSRFPIYFLSFYFLIFSGSRTSLVIFVFFLAFITIKRLKEFRQRQLYIVLNLLFVISFVLLLSFKSFLLLIKDTRIGFLNEYIFRTEEGLDEGSDLQDVATRVWIWNQHFEIYSQNPIFGVGTYSFDDYKGRVTKAYQNSSGSESFITALLARIGLLSLLVILLLFIIQNEALKKRNPLSYFLSLYIFIVMLSYGSFIVPYNFMFLLLFGLINNTMHKRIN